MAVHVAAKRAISSIHGLIVVDVVEVHLPPPLSFSPFLFCLNVLLLTDYEVNIEQGTAMASLIHMRKILSSRMQHFPTIEKAVHTFEIDLSYIPLKLICLLIIVRAK